ncbi:hypothetical protein FACS1894193_07680 [Bacilli bacterium]|nr:hypothetical protein FACS1894193_07680 [Bacilli bacterium]
MRTKQLALWGNILGTIAAIITLLIALQDIILTEMIYEGAYISTPFVIGQLIGGAILIVAHVFTWIAYVKIGKPSEKGWKIFLLVMGIIWACGAAFGLLISFIRWGEWLVLLGNLLNLTQSILFILTFALKDKKPEIRNQQSEMIK